jgi:hypothetical protein
LISYQLVGPVLHGNLISCRISKALAHMSIGQPLLILIFTICEIWLEFTLVKFLLLVLRNGSSSWEVRIGLLVEIALVLTVSLLIDHL